MVSKNKVAVAAASTGGSGIGFAMNAIWPELMPKIAPVVLVVSIFLMLVALMLWASVFLDWLRQTNGSIPRFIPTWRLNRDSRGLSFSAEGVLPFRRLIPLCEATKRAYPKINNRPEVQVLEGMEKDPSKLPSLVAQILLNRPGFDIRVYGVKPPLGKFEEIPADDVKRFRFSDDANELIDQYDDKRRYQNIAISRCDFSRRIKELS